MFILDESGKIKVSQGDTFSLNVISNIPFKEGDTVTLSVKKDLSDDDCVIKKVITTFTPCPNNEEQSIAIFNFTSLDTSIDAGNYLYDIQLDYKETGVRYTAMWPTKFTVREDVTPNITDMGTIQPINPGNGGE